MTTLLTGGGKRQHDLLDDDVDLARDRALVTRAQTGDSAAFDDLYVRYYRRLYRFCLRRLHDSYEAEDVAQEAFARAWRALPTFAGDRRFYPWLSVIAAHLCTDVLRRRSRSTPVAEFHQGNLASTEDDGEELVLAAVDSDLVARAFTRLSERHQRILHLREGSGWSYQRIADHEGVGITAVETLLWRARQALKREFAALAGAEGRIAAWIGAAVSVASLRRLLRMRLGSARRILHLSHTGPAVAIGSAAAATAVVVAATLSSPMPVTQDHLGTLTGGLPGAKGISSASAPAARSSAASASEVPKATRTPPPGETPSPSGAPPSSNAGESAKSPAPGGPSLVTGTTASLGDASGAVGSAVGSTIGNAIAGAASGVSSTVQSVAGGVVSILDPIAQLPLGNLSGVVGQLGSTANGVAGALDGTVSSLGSDLSGTVQTATGDIASILDGSSAPPSTSGGSVSASGTSSTDAGAQATTCSANGLGGLVDTVTGSLVAGDSCSG